MMDEDDVRIYTPRHNPESSSAINRQMQWLEWDLDKVIRAAGYILAGAADELIEIAHGECRRPIVKKPPRVVTPELRQEMRRRIQIRWAKRRICA